MNFDLLRPLGNIKTFFCLINVWKNLRRNSEWTIQKHSQHWALDTEWKQAKKEHNTEN